MHWIRTGTTGAPATTLHCGQHATQYVDLIGVGLGAIEEAADATHECGAALRAIAEAHLFHHHLEVRVEAIHVCWRGQWHFARGRDLRRPVLRHADLVGNQLRRHGHIQRGVFGIGRNEQQRMRRQQLFVGESVALGAKQYGNARACGCSIARFLHCTNGAFAGLHHSKIVITLAGGGGQDQATVRNCLGQCCHHPRGQQQVVGPGSACSGLRMREFPRIDQDQVAQPHVLHGARHCPDIAGVRRIDEDKAYR